MPAVEGPPTLISAAIRGLDRFRREWTCKRVAKHVYDAFKVCMGFLWLVRFERFAVQADK